MSNAPGARDRHKAATRLAISNTATRLFLERGFEAVSVSEVAQAAGVSRKTVFNYFASKEELVFDRVDEVRDLLAAALRDRGGRPPVQALRAASAGWIAAAHPVARMDARPAAFWRMVGESPALTSRALMLQHALTGELARILAGAAGRPPGDPAAGLAAALVMAALAGAYRAGLDAQAGGGDPAAVLPALLLRGFDGVEAALAGTPYA